MIKFREKSFSEYDAMRSLYVEIMKLTKGDKQKFPIIDKSSLIPILRGNNIVIERFVISSSFFGRDKYRMYLKIGARAKMPDEVRLPGKYYDERLGKLSFEMSNGIFANNKGGQDNNNNGGKKDQNNNNGGRNQKDRGFSDVPRQGLFSKGGGIPPYISTKFGGPELSITKEVHKLLGDAVKYDKPGRSLVLEFDTIQDAIAALNILPFGLNYKIYLLGD